ncbi:MAG: hypothetical protein IJP10_04360 [Clostridia bacterium]|nr:hypothetical protein [Clostridia bacterium]
MIVTALFSDYDLAESAAHNVREHLPRVVCRTRCEENISARETDWHVTDITFSDRTVSDLFLIQSALFTGSAEELREPDDGKENAMLTSGSIAPFGSRAVVIAKGSKADVDIAANILRGNGGETVKIYGEQQ